MDQSADTLTPRSWIARIVWDGEIGTFVRVAHYVLLTLSAAVPFAWGYAPSLRGDLWDVSWYAVTLLMCIRPIGDLLPDVFLFRALLPLRQGLGILSSVVVATNAGFAYLPDFANFLTLYTSARMWGFETRLLFARLAEIVGIILLITSNSLSQRLLGKWWKRIQRLSYVYFFAAGIYLAHIGSDAAIPAMILVGALWIAAFVKNRRSS